MVNKTCSWGTCKHASTKQDTIDQGITFRKFPTPVLQRERCLEWIKRCGQPHEKLNIDKPFRWRYVCSKHFEDGNDDPVFASPYTETPKPRKRKRKETMSSEPEEQSILVYHHRNEEGLPLTFIKQEVDVDQNLTVHFESDILSHNYGDADFSDDTGCPSTEVDPGTSRSLPFHDTPSHGITPIHIVQNLHTIQSEQSASSTTEVCSNCVKTSAQLELERRLHKTLNISLSKANEERKQLKAELEQLKLRIVETTKKASLNPSDSETPVPSLNPSDSESPVSVKLEISDSEYNEPEFFVESNETGQSESNLKFTESPCNALQQKRQKPESEQMKQNSGDQILKFLESGKHLPTLLREHHIMTCPICHVVYFRFSTMKNHLVEHLFYNMLLDKVEIFQELEINIENLEKKMPALETWPKLDSSKNTVKHIPTTSTESPSENLQDNNKLAADIEAQLPHFESLNVLHKDTLTSQDTQSEIVERLNVFLNCLFKSSDFPYTCCLCNIKVVSKKKLNYHRVSQHRNDDQCFYIERQLVNTYQTITEKPKSCYVCERCGKTSFKLSVHQRHMMIHEDESPYKCKICNMNFKYEALLQNHMRRRHKEKSDQSKTGKSKSWICDVCGTSRSTRAGLRMHIAHVHTGEKIFKCRVCLLRFSLMTEYQKHIRSEHDEFKKHVCDLCGLRFFREGDLKRHSFNHHKSKTAGQPVQKAEEINEHVQLEQVENHQVQNQAQIFEVQINDTENYEFHNINSENYEFHNINSENYEFQSHEMHEFK